MLSTYLKHRLSWKLLLSVLLFSTVITLFGAGVQIYLDYQRDLRDIDERINNIRLTHLESLTTSLWKLDEEQLTTELNNIALIQDVLAVKVHTVDGVDYAADRMDVKGEQTRSQRFIMHYQDDRIAQQLGELEVIVSLSGARGRLVDRLLVILGTEALKIFLLSIFFLFITHFLIVRHLRGMASYARALRIGHLDEELELERPSHAAARRDDLDEVVDALNTMRHNLRHDMAERERIEEELRRHRDELDLLVVQRTEELAGKNRLFEVIGRLQSQFIREPEPTIMFDKLLQDIIALTGSAFGLIGDVLHGEDGKPYLKCYAFSNVAWDNETRRFYEEHKESGFVFTKLDNLFGHVITTGRPVIANDPAGDPRGHGTPPGHPKLEAFLGIPVYYGEQLVGEIGLANREGGYDEELLTYLQPIVDTCGRIIVARWEREARQEAERGVKQLQGYLQSVIDFMPSALIGLDGDQKITQWNRGAQEMTGISPARAMGRQFDEVLELPPEPMMALKDALTRQNSMHIEQLPQQVGNEERFLNVVLYPLGEQREEMVLRLDDVTERVRMEMMMAQSEKMMSVGGLAAGMAHELNNPLGGMLQGLQNIRRRFSPTLDKNVEVARELGFDLEKAQSYLDERGISQFITTIIESGERAAEIVNNMLIFTRKPVKRFEYEPLTPIIEQVIELAAIDYDLKKQHDFRNIEIERDYDRSLPDVPCIKSEIQQVLLNLLRNAAQAMSGQEQPARLILRCFKRGEMACIEVEDNGPGMDEATCKRVFEPFFTTKPPGQGTGLGMSVSYFIVHDEHHGRISVNSKPGKGATFRFCLPLKQQEGAQ